MKEYKLTQEKFHRAHKILYINGLKRSNSSTESRTATTLRESLDPKKYHIIAPTFPANRREAFTMAKKIIKEEYVDIVIASSLGGFIAMQLKNVAKIVINPCIRPDIELPKRGNNLAAESYINSYNSLWSNIDDKEKSLTFGVFSEDDELFSYRDKFSQYYNNIIDIKDGHRISENNVREVIIPLIKEMSIEGRWM